jgi:metallo-beta-lactamase class B
MRSKLAVLVASLFPAISLAQGPTPLESDKPIVCGSCDAWNAAREPFRVFGNTYYVGPAGLSSVLVVSEKGHVLLDGALPQSAAVIDANIRALGFRTQDIRLIVTSHEHFDHVGGVAALQRASGAMVASSSAGAQALRQGEPTPDDPQHGYGRKSMGFPPVHAVRVVTDGETLRVGDLAITAHLTPGHTPGSTTWTWRSCEGARCFNIVYADSLNPVSAPGFQFTRHRGRVDLFRQSIAKVQNLSCDIILSVHPEFSNMDARLKRRAEGVSPDPFVDSSACQAYGDAASRSLDRRIEAER